MKFKLVAIAAAAVASDDEHDHSLVFSAFEEFRVFGDPLYKVVAHVHY